MVDISKALHDPANVYKFPRDVLADAALSSDDKRQILQRWEHDALELMVAEEENMSGDSSPTMLSRVRRAIQSLQEE